jgi:hypothetical protein
MEAWTGSPDARRQSEHGARGGGTRPAAGAQRAHEYGADRQMTGALRERLG